MKLIKKLEPPFKPLLCQEAIEFFDSIVGPDTTVFEFGSGASTLWLAQRAKHVMSVEHDEEWFDEVQRVLQEHYLYAEVWLIPEVEKEYPRAIQLLPGWSADIVFIDGLDRTRHKCVMYAMEKIVPGGWLVLDDTSWPRLKPSLRLLAAWERTDYTGEKSGRSDGKVVRGRTSFFKKPEWQRLNKSK